MKSKFSSLIIAAVLGLSGVAFSANALAEEGKLVGPITKITMAADGKSATAVLKDKRIVEGDEIRARFEKDGKNTSKSFKKTAGC
jgi:hypothetical protein